MWAGPQRLWDDEMSVPAYTDELHNQTERILLDHPDIPHTWRGDALVFLTTEASGFEIRLHPEEHGIVVFAGLGLHEHFEESPAEAVRDALGLVRDLLSPDMRVRELRAGRFAYRWILERMAGDRWLPESETGLLFWNYFGKRSQRIYQNKALPGRLSETIA